MKLTNLFTTSYGTKLDLNKMIIVDESDHDAINFISRTSKNLGIITKVKKISNKEPLQSGLITVTLGGSYLLSSFIQLEPFYTAQNIIVLEPKKEMSFEEKIFYCMCITKNRFRYTSHGREANRTIKNMILPDSIPDWIYEISTENLTNKKSCIDITMHLTDRKWKYFQYSKLFTIEKGTRLTNAELKDGDIPCIRAISHNNGIDRFIDVKPNHTKNTITVNYDGSVGESFYQPVDHFSIDSTNVLYTKFQLNVYIAMFLITLMKLERKRYNFGYKWNKTRMVDSKIKLPVNADNNPDWQFMEKYIKSLPYSGNLENL